MTQSSCKRDTKSKSHVGMKLKFSHVNTPLERKEAGGGGVGGGGAV